MASFFLRVLREWGNRAQKVLVTVLPVHPGASYVNAELFGRNSLGQQVLKLEELTRAAPGKSGLHARREIEHGGVPWSFRS